MNRLVFLLAVLAISLQSWGQANFNIQADTLYQGCDSTVDLYLYADSLKSTAYTYDSIGYYFIPAGGTNVAMSDDQVLGPFSVGFDVSWFCGSYSNFYICSNGWIGFQNTSAAFTPQQIPSTANNVPKNAIMGVWRDWHPGITGGPYITRQTLGTAPNRKLVVTWSSVPMYSCTSTYGTFQIVVHETSNIIHTNFTNMPTCLTWVGGDGVHGVHNPAGTYGLAVTGRNDTPFTTSNESTRFIPTSPIVWVTQSGDTLGIGNELTASLSTSQYVYAYGLTCANDSVKDSVFVSASCIEMKMDSFNVECTNDSSGYIVAIDTSVQTAAPYTFYWTDAYGDTVAIHNSTDSIDTLWAIPAGTYTAMAVDVAGQFALKTVSISEPDTIFYSGLASSIDVLCNGGSTGKAYVVDTNNYSNLNTWDGNYTYYWAGGNGNLIDSTIMVPDSSDTLSNLPIGVYHVTVDGCFISVDSTEVDEPNALLVSISNETMTSCPGIGNCDASAEANALGGVTPYSFAWSSNETGPDAFQLCPDTNWVTVTDVNGCMDTMWTVILIPDTIKTDGFGDTLICITNPAAIAASSTGGTAPFTYVWRLNALNGPLVANTATHTVFPEKTTAYFVKSVDANGCPGDSAKVLIKVRPPLGAVMPDLDTICPYDDIDITAAGLGGDTNYTFAWSAGFFGPTITVSPDEPTWYHVTVSDACGTPQHLDSVWVQVGGYSPIDVEIRVEDDSICAGENVYLIASGRGGHKGPEEFVFDWSNGQMDGNPIQFVRPTKTTEYTVTISDLCLSPAGTATRTIYVGKPQAPGFKVDPEIACSNAEVEIVLNSYNPKYRYNWEMGDGNTLFNYQNDTVPYSFKAPGCYDVTLSVVTDFECRASRQEKCLVQILEAPEAEFSYHPEHPTQVDPIVTFKDESVMTESYTWFVEDDTLYNRSQFTHEFVDTGLYNVMLIAVSPDGCVDTTIKTIHHTHETTLFIPTSFTPNGDGLNDVFLIQGEAIDFDMFEFSIYNRWGERIFFSINPLYGWDGRETATGEKVTGGSYPYVLKYKRHDSVVRTVRGHVLVSKTGNPTGLR